MIAVGELTPTKDRRNRKSTAWLRVTLARRTPLQAFNARPKAFPTGYQIPPHYRVRHDRIDAAGVITLRYNSRLHTLA
jgi:hypothetical protein